MSALYWFREPMAYRIILGPTGPSAGGASAAAEPGSSGRSAPLSGDERGVVIPFRDGRQPGDDLTPVVAAVIARPHLTRRGRGEERERVAPILKTHCLERRPEPVGKPRAKDLPRPTAIRASGDARAGEMAFSPRARTLFGGCDEHELRPPRVEHEKIGISADLVLEVGPLFPRGAAIAAHVH